MSYEDVVRVAQAKIAPARMRRIAQDELRVNGEPYSVHDFLKPGIEELSQLLPPFLARRILRMAERKGWLGRVYFGMEINSTSVSGYLRFLMLAKLRPLRPYGYRYKQEQQQIDGWLALIREAAQHSAELALEIAECARLIKGYGDTHARGLANYRAIEDTDYPAGAGGPNPTGARGRRHCQRTDRRACRPRRREPHQMPRRHRWPAGLSRGSGISRVFVSPMRMDAVPANGSARSACPMIISERGPIRRALSDDCGVWVPGLACARPGRQE